MAINNNTLGIEEKVFVPNFSNKYMSQSRRRVLLVEDSQSDVALIKRMMSDVSFDGDIEFVDVPRVVDALELLDYSHFDLILLDLCLLDIDGVASVAAINSESPNVPIVVYSGTDDPQLKEEALMCGAKHYLVKGKESPFALKFMINQTMACSQQ